MILFQFYGFYYSISKKKSKDDDGYNTKPSNNGSSLVRLALFGFRVLGSK